MSSVDVFSSTDRVTYWSIKALLSTSACSLRFDSSKTEQSPDLEIRLKGYFFVVVSIDS